MAPRQLGGGAARSALLSLFAVAHGRDSGLKNLATSFDNDGRRYWMERNRMATKRTKKTQKAESPYREVEAYLAQDPELRGTLRLFDISMRQYVQALGNPNNPRITTTASSSPV